MENEEIILNNIMINKLDSMSYDIKCYMNINYGITQSLDNRDGFKFMDSEEINELFEIRKRIKQLSHKLKNK